MYIYIFRFFSESEKGDICIYIHVYSDSLQLQVLTRCQVECPVIYRRSLWVMYFVCSRLCLLIPTSYFIPSPASFPSGVFLVQSLSRVWLCSRTDCSPPGSSVHGILQARILDWVAMPSSRGSSQPSDRTRLSCVFCTGRQILQCTRYD